MDFNLNDILKQAKNLQGQVSGIQEELAMKRVEGQSGGGMVTVTLNGRQEVLDVRIDPVCVDSRDIPMLEDLIAAAFNQGVKKAKELSSEEMKKLTGGIPLPFDLS
ncbi:MAG: YbaB/EbfC family nucleoid-associated protein [Thermodesulfobacteriota bacterium]|nr:YbaB/EbfC family nucleoid-associated protein [Thermodesulfobacteriota bacterium]